MIAKQEIKRTYQEGGCYGERKRGTEDSDTIFAEMPVIFVHIDSSTIAAVDILAVQIGTYGADSISFDYCDLRNRYLVCGICRGKKDAESKILVGIIDRRGVFPDTIAGVSVCQQFLRRNR